MISSYEIALEEVGPDGKFQKRFDSVYNVVLPAMWAMAYMNIVLALVVTSHNCRLPHRPENVTEYSWKLKYIPISQNISGRSIFSSCSIYENPNESNVITACDEFEYDTTWYKSTVPSDNNWVCDKELYVADIYAYIKIGEVIGSLFFGWFGDRYGRRLTYIITLGLIIIGRFISILIGHSFSWFLCGCLIASFSSWSVTQCVTVTSIEISSPNRRTVTSTLHSVSWTAGVCLMPFLYWWLRDWKLFLAVTTATQVPFFIFSWKMIESPRWLWVEGRTEACVNELKRIAKVNKTKLRSNLLEGATPAIEKTSSFGPLALFFGWRLSLHTILQLLLWICVSLGYTVLIMSSGEKSDGNPFLEFAWQSAAEIPGHFLGAWLADNIGRRYSGALSYLICAATWAIIAFREYSNYDWIRSWWLGSILVIVTKLFTTVSYYLIKLLNIELYPTCLRQSGMSLGNVLSSVAAAIAPFVIYLGRRSDPRWPGAILALVSFSGILFSLLLPETLNVKLPETLQDAQQFGKM